MPAPTDLARSGKIESHHLDRLAVVYVRQSSLAQLHRHQESTRLQYALAQHAQHLGWPHDRVLVIDDDQGKSGSTAEGRPGFARLVTEVTLGHVGLILGIEMSRLARSNRDWHHLLEVCALFGTLIADTDGVYDPAQYNDRLLLGLKGTMSEAELHVLKNRLHQGKLNKARRGELGVHVPSGYIRNVYGAIEFDPDEQVQHVIRLIFRKFDELGTLNAVLQYLVRHSVLLGVRERTRGGGGRLTWRVPNRMTLQNILHHPIYAGTYAYGRRQTDARKKHPGRAATGRVTLPPDAWHVLLRDHVPAYISWAQHQDNLARLAANRNHAASSGAPRRGIGLLSGLLVCGTCGHRMTVRYKGPYLTYLCNRLATDYAGPGCFSFAGRAVDAWVGAELLRALTPASLELSLETVAHLEQERADLAKVWQQRLERARYEAERAERQYSAVEPENRLVARTLEKRWEEALNEQRRVQEDFERFLHQQPRRLSAEDIAMVRDLAQNLPALWSAASTTPQERKEIVRLVIERIVVTPLDGCERLGVRVEWVGGHVTEGVVVRPVARVKQLSYHDELCRCVTQGVQRGKLAQEVADELNAAGWRPSKRRDTWNAEQVRELARTLGLHFRQGADGRRLGPLAPEREGDWWTLQGLALTLGMPTVTLYSWLRRGEVRAERRVAERRWRVWADEAEVARLRAEYARPAAERVHDMWVKRAQGQAERDQEVRDV